MITDKKTSELSPFQKKGQKEKEASEEKVSQLLRDIYIYIYILYIHVMTSQTGIIE